MRPFFLFCALFLLPAGVFAQPAPGADVFARLAREGHARGSEDAPVSVIEFSDFQCGFCRRFWQETLPRIDEKYIQSGAVRFIHRHFAILGKPSIAAARAAECAGDQEKFWPYHDRLFANLGSVSAFSDGRLKAYAKEIGLDGRAFNRCVDSGRNLEKVQGETAIGMYLGVRGTPAFFINGRLLAGAQPFKAFESVIERALKDAASPAKRGNR
jgi:protein-disulfide isomerase